jgi:hypothetical protein
VKSDGEWGMLGIKGDKISEAGIRIHYKPSSDSLFHVYQLITAHSHSHTTALEKADHIRHTMSIDSNIVNIDNYYTYPIADKLRLQDVEIYIEIPSGKTVKINNEVIRLGADPFNEQKMDEHYEEKGHLDGDGTYSHWD